jgi:hypothetical protein
MRRYNKKVTLRKLNEPATVKICGTTPTLHEIAKRPYGTVNGRPRCIAARSRRSTGQLTDALPTQDHGRRDGRADR